MFSVKVIKPLQDVLLYFRQVEQVRSIFTFKDVTRSRQEHHHPRFEFYSTEAQIQRNKLTGRIDTVRNLYKFGFSHQQTSELLRDFPRLGLLDVQGSLEAWSGFPFNRESCVRLLSKHPNLVALPYSCIGKLRMELQFRFKDHQIFKLLLHSPNIATESLNYVKVKLEYLIDELKVPTNEVAITPGALSHSHQHLQLRHAFLVRAGLYRVPDPKKGALFKNPSLNEILNTSDKIFATDIATGLTLSEYEVFKQVFELEED